MVCMYPDVQLGESSTASLQQQTKEGMLFMETREAKYYPYMNNNYNKGQMKVYSLCKWG